MSFSINFIEEANMANCVFNINIKLTLIPVIRKAGTIRKVKRKKRIIFNI